MSDHRYEVAVGVLRDGEEIPYEDIPEDARPKVAGSLIRCAADLLGGYRAAAAHVTGLAEIEAAHKARVAAEAAVEAKAGPRLLMPDECPDPDQIAQGLSSLRGGKRG